MSSLRPLISGGPDIFAYDSAPAIQEHVTQVAIDATGNFAVRSTQTPRAVIALLRAIANSLESETPK